MNFLTARFQKGAIEFAQIRGIALAQVADGRTSCATKSCDELPTLPPWVPPYVGWIISLSEEGNESFRFIYDGESEILLDKVPSKCHITLY